MPRNPPWSREELILALDVYLRVGMAGSEHPEVLTLSRLLNRLRLHADRPDPERFRNPNGAAMKLANFAALDPTYPGVALSRGGRGDAAIWEEFAADRPRLAREARALRERADRSLTTGRADGATGAVGGERPLGVPYQRANEVQNSSPRQPFDVDPNVVDRGLRGHAATQNALANLLASRGLIPRSPASHEADFDLAWEHDGRIFVAEVKSLTQANEERQLRLGLGQVLRYRHLLARGGREVVPVLAVEHQPAGAAASVGQVATTSTTSGRRAAAAAAARDACRRVRRGDAIPRPAHGRAGALGAAARDGLRLPGLGLAGRGGRPATEGAGGAGDRALPAGAPSVTDGELRADAAGLPDVLGQQRAACGGGPAVPRRALGGGDGGSPGGDRAEWAAGGAPGEDRRAGARAGADLSRRRRAGVLVGAE
jgi:hypothetical protein